MAALPPPALGPRLPALPVVVLHSGVLQAVVVAWRSVVAVAASLHGVAVAAR